MEATETLRVPKIVMRRKLKFFKTFVKWKLSYLFYTEIEGRNISCKTGAQSLNYKLWNFVMADQFFKKFGALLEFLIIIIMISALLIRLHTSSTLHIQFQSFHILWRYSASRTKLLDTRKVYTFSFFVWTFVIEIMTFHCVQKIFLL